MISSDSDDLNLEVNTNFSSDNISNNTSDNGYNNTQFKKRKKICDNYITLYNCNLLLMLILITIFFVIYLNNSN